MERAPFFEELAEGPRGGGAYWLTTADGVRIRIGLWPAARGGTEKGTVFLLPGRTEYVEKYGPAAGDLAERGFATITVDFRGQGLADRAHDDRNLGHVHHFDEYQLDVDALAKAAHDLDLPRPFFLLTHSMGGCIGLRALHRGLAVQASMFSAPMWGIQLAPPVRPFAWGLSWLSHHSNMGHNYAPGTGSETYVTANPFDDNQLTTHRPMYEFMQRQARAHPALALGGPSLSWLFAALSETRDLARLPAPAMPSLTFLGTNERIVDTAPIHARMSDWSGGVLEMIGGAEHEVLMEGPELRARIYDQTVALFNTHA
ncbi:alpha/beta hydrolase [Aliiroseovarius subalbicans]|uniref:alpha/beta fold hydrolase n=1 Tax=Aliiroseovarius subalbicans TaxID=2925840 RepID=UPI001F56E4DD|nr:alpha/beta hydrolase [Aliiroseovarius subalbicans]MCI2398077.1 alpha/beta hydrolase [Aliiroseovarius subalbicans]